MLSRALKDKHGNGSLVVVLLLLACKSIPRQARLCSVCDRVLLNQVAHDHAGAERRAEANSLAIILAGPATTATISIC